MTQPQPDRRPSPIVRTLVIDGSLVLGWTLVSVGAGLAYLPAGLMVAGALLLALGVKGVSR